MQTIMFSVDWCQYSCGIIRGHQRLATAGATSTELTIGLKPGDTLQGSEPCGAWFHPHYKVVPGREFSKQYLSALTITFKGFDVAHVFYDPRRVLDHPGRCVWKAANRLLYMQDWGRTFLDIIHAAGCYVISLSRLDICADINTFADDLHPAEFISRYLHAPTKDRPSYLRHSSNKFRVHGQKNVYDDGSAPEVQLQTLSFGTRDSAVQVNLYNKSEELRAKDKPYIRAAWQETGLDPEDVWRVEFSLNSRGVCALKWDTGLVAELRMDEFERQAGLADVFLCYAKQYFSFHVYFDGDTRGIRSLPYATLFENPERPIVKPISINLQRGTGRTEKLCYKVLRRIADQAQSMTPEQIKAYDLVISELTELSGIKDAIAAGELAPRNFLDIMAQSIYADGHLCPQGWTTAVRERLHRLCAVVLTSPSEDVQAYVEVFEEFLHRFGFIEWEEMSGRVVLPKDYREIFARS